MKFLDIELGRRRTSNALVPVVRAPVAPIAASSVVGQNPSYGGWWPLIREPYAGAWQRNMEVRADHVILNVTVFRCTSLISTDIAKMRIKLVQFTSDNVWVEAQNNAYSPVLTKPNHFQNRIQFIENWVNSRLNHGNVYVLKERDGRNVVVGLYILDPRRVRPLVAETGDVFYQLYADDLSGIPTNITVPASEIIHDRWNCLFHPLVGLSPIVANGLVATQGLRIQEHSVRFFKNAANPGGILTAPGKIDNDTALRLKEDWQERFSGNNVGFVAVLGDGLKYEAMSTTPTDAQLIEQLKWTGESVAASYGVPAYKVGAGPVPTGISVDALETQYYQSCLQIHIEAIELCLDEGLSLPNSWGLEFDLDGLLRMDATAQMKYLSDGVGSAIIEPNEARGKLGMAPKPGGDALYLQQQNYSLEALAKRDKSENPFAYGKQSGSDNTNNNPPLDPNQNQNNPNPDQMNSIRAGLLRKLANVSR